MTPRFFARTVFILVFGASCSEESIPLIKKYTVAWEADHSGRYSVYSPFPQVIASFNHLHENADGTLLVMSTITPHQNLTLTRLSESGEFISDLTINDTYILQVSKDEDGNMITLSASDNMLSIKKWNADLSIQYQRDFERWPYFFEVRLNGDFYYVVTIESDVQKLTKYSLEGSLRWTKLFTDYEISRFTNPEFSSFDGDLLLKWFVPTYDSVRFVKVDQANGNVKWNSIYRMLDINDVGRVRTQFILPSGEVLVSGSSDQASPVFYLTRLDSKGRIKEKKEVQVETDVLPGNMFLERDGGILISLGGNWTTDASNFKLLKMDSRYNPGWIGTFNLFTNAGLSQLLQTKSGHIVLMSSDGYFYGLTSGQ